MPTSPTRACRMGKVCCGNRMGAALRNRSENGARGASARAPGSARASTSTKSTRMPSRSAAKVSSTQPAKCSSVSRSKPRPLSACREQRGGDILAAA
ncbi:hypothetical protein G6F59_018372 [Rhizopus arrhizus]|nr:hypothetical protein G6F59_018372 [Rhizopus arrhizus]